MASVMDDLETSQISIPEENEENEDPFECDPTFETKSDLDAFLKTCNLKRGGDSDEEDVDFDYSVKRECNCNICEDIFSGSYQHLCCHQYNKWNMWCDSSEVSKCITETVAFQQATNHFAVRNLLMQMVRKRKSTISDPPPNGKMRKAFYRATYLFIDGASRKRKPLPSCVMAVCRQRYPSEDGIYCGFLTK